MTAPLLGYLLPNVKVQTSEGEFLLHDYQGDSWLMFCSYAADYSPVCLSELAELAQQWPEFEKRNVKLIALSCDSVQDHQQWASDVLAFCKAETSEKLPYPIIADPSRELAIMFGMLDSHAKDDQGIALAGRAVFIWDSDRKLRLSLLYPGAVGRNINEILRTIKALQLGDKRKIVTPANWSPGDRVIIPPTAKVADYPEKVTIQEMPSGKQYMRWTTVSD